MDSKLILTQRISETQSGITGNYSGNSGDGNNYGDSVNIATNHGGVHYYRALSENESGEGGPTQPYWMVPYSRNSRFVGRAGILESLEEQVGEDGLNRIALHGLGGSGKTQIALEYAYRLKDTRHIFWVHASGFPKFREDYTRIAREARISVLSPTGETNQEEVLQGVKLWFESAGSGDWILLLDNADNVVDFESNNSEISRFLPQGAKGSIILTTRSRAVAEREGCNVIQVGKVSDVEGQELFSRQLRIPDSLQAEDEQAVANLLDFLGHLPLAITGAAAFMLETSTSPSDYWSLIQESDKQAKRLLSSDFRVLAREADMTESILSTFFITFDRIRLQTPMAANILRLIAFLDRQNIPKDLIVQSGLEGVSDSLDFRRAMGTLLGFSLVSEERDREVYELHRLVQLSVHVYLSPREVSEWRARATEAVSTLYPEYDHEVRHVCAVYLPHALAVMGDSTGPTVDELHCRVASHLQSTGYYNDAEIHIRRCISGEKIGHQVPGGVHGLIGIRTYIQQILSLLVQSFSNALRYISFLLFRGHKRYYRRYWRRHGLLAIILESQGRYAEAESLSRQVLRGTEKTLGPGHPDARACIYNLGAVLRELGNYTEAERMFRHALEAKWWTAEGEDLTGLHNLGLALCNLGRYEEAEGMLRRAMEGREKALGSEHFGTLATAHNLAWALTSLGRFEEAENIYRKVQDGEQRSLRPEHPQTLTCTNNLASVLDKRGKYHEAEEEYRRALEGFEKALGPEHPTTLDVIKNLASVLTELGQYQEAMEMLWHVLESHEKSLGPGHPDTIATLHNLGWALYKRGWYDQAELALERVLLAREKVLGLEHPDTLDALSHLALVFKDLEKYEEAKGMSQAALKLREKVLGQEHPHTLASVSNLAHLYSDLGDHQEAKLLNLRALSAREAHLGPDHPDTLASTANLARCYFDLGEYATAEHLQRRALSVSTELYGEEHPDTLTLMNNLGATLGRLGRPSCAEDMFRKTLSAREELLGSEHPDTLATLQNLADVLGEVGRHGDSVAMLGRALGGCERSLGAGHGTTRMCSMNSYTIQTGESKQNTVMHNRYSLNSLIPKVTPQPQNRQPHMTTRPGCEHVGNKSLGTGPAA
ncbi:TPR-like protein [Tuber magnatum]|uniref:TPR-like protein n=1 Tax=Tuber magnatum TaxID=42249 RepID=A0A317SNP2_9PEZI|nr:TPR-like protein [Tuber magnatum]